MATNPLPLNCILACASATAYGIDPLTGNYTPVEPYSGAVSFSAGPSVINSTGSDRINAALVGLNANGIIVAFRGTLPPTNVDSIPDWFEDFLDVPTTCGALPGKVHAGFCHDLHTILGPVIDAAKSYDPSKNKVYVTGHSKGGALASLGAYLLIQAGIPVQQVITYASPRTGDPDFQAGYQKVIPNQIRYESYGDIVPLVPPSNRFIGGLTAVVSKVPNIGERLAAALKRAEAWEYVPVGQEYFIESAANGYAINTGESERDQVGDVIVNLVTGGLNIGRTIGDAHAIACKFGYMSGACTSGVCEGAPV